MNRLNEIKEILESMLVSEIDIHDVWRTEEILAGDFEGTMLEDVLAVPLGLYSPSGVPRHCYYDGSQLRELISRLLPEIDSLASRAAEA